MNNLRKEIYCTLHIEGLHHWPKCPLDEVDYLRQLHRHMFHIKAYKHVTHADRDIEFIMLKHDIEQYLGEKYYDSKRRMCVFGAMSCEMIAEELINNFDLSGCDVSEDGENGAVLMVEEETNDA